MVNDSSLSADAARARNVTDSPSIASLLTEAALQGVARLDAEVLLQQLTRHPRAHLLAYADEAVDTMTAALFRIGVQRRAAGEPLAYITGVREFWSLPLVVTPAVLVPRPETELLVERCLDRFDSAPRRIADLGTGSGAIALALACERPQWSLVATDIAADALEIAAINCKRLQLTNVSLNRGSWCEALTGMHFDAIVSNPPYISADHPALHSLQHEPQSALVAADNGFADLKAIATAARQWLRAGGALLLEHGTDQAHDLELALESLGYVQVTCYQDLAGHDRVTEAIWPPSATTGSVAPRTRSSTSR